MTWSPPNNTLLCHNNPSLPQCQPAALAFLSFLTHYFGHSYDAQFTDSNYEKDSIANKEYDFIIVGAGSAGCVLANRLSEIKDWQILLLEAGDEEPVVTELPAQARPVVVKSSIDYDYQTQPEPIACAGMVGKICSWPRGKGMGGSSLINGMVYVRGLREDYDEWERLGNPGWGYEDVLPYFKKIEDFRIPKLLTENPKSYGTDGYVTVGYFPYENEYTPSILQAWKEFGLEEVDYNAGNGMIGYAKTQRATINGARQSMNGAYIRTIRGRRKNLRIQPRTRVTRILINPRTKHAYGVEFVKSDNSMKRHVVYARKEVILSAGAIDSPRLLMLSGIGPADELKRCGIPLIKELSVGKNLQDHPAVLVATFNVTSIYSDKSSEDLYDLAVNDFTYWLSNREGVASSIGLFETSAYLQTSYESRPGVAEIGITFDGYSINNTYVPKPYYNRAAMGIFLLHPKSRGEIQLNRSDPIFGKPIIYANYFTHQDDVKVMVEGLRMSRKLFDTKTFKNLDFVDEGQIGCEHFKFDSDAYWYCVIRLYSSTTYHPVGTCKMGPKNDVDAVVDSTLKVYDIDRLRVIDAAIMPQIVRANTMAPTLMTAEKGSDMIKKHWLCKS